MNIRQAQLPQGWKIKKLSEIGNVFNGNSINAKIKKEKYLGLDNGLPYIGTKDIGFDSIIDYENGVKIPLTEKELFKIAPKNTPLICVEGGSAGRKIGFTNQDVCFGNKLFALVPNKSVNSRFLFYYYFSSSFQIHFSNEMTGIIGGVSMSKFKSIEIPLPPLPEQQRIVAILDQCFAAIDKAKANAEQNLKNAKELFESYLNSIKADKVDLGSLVDIKTGKLNANAAVENGEYPFFTCSREVYAIDKYAFDLEAILLAGNNASGDFNVKHYKGKFNAYQRTYVITVNEKQKVLYRYLYFQLLKSLKEFKEMSVGANTRFLKLGMIQGLKIALPTIEEQQTIVRQLDALRAETQKLEAVYQKKIADLEELKKSILQKAFAGELRSPEGVASANDGYSPSEKKTKNKISPERA
jgi:type I restriction enzyme S subunit